MIGTGAGEVPTIRKIIDDFDKMWLHKQEPKELKPLPQPGWREDRLSRRPASGIRDTARYNSSLLGEFDDILHPTKGFRYLSPMRMQRIVDTASQLGKFYPSGRKKLGPRYMPHQGDKECRRRSLKMSRSGLTGA